MSYARVIVNPIAGAGKTARKWRQIMGFLKDIGLHFDYDVTEASGHAIELAKTAAMKGYEVVVAVGGDGTLNEVVNGIYDANSLARVMVGVINTGAGGDYIRSVGIPRDPEEACHCLSNPRKLRLDLGVAEYVHKGQTLKRLFVNFAGVGLDAEVVKATTERFKALGSVPSYLMGLLTTFLFYRNREMHLTVDGKSEERAVCAAVVSNGRYGGGGMLVAPDANPADGLLDIMTIGDLGKLDLLWSLPRVYKGTHLTHPKVAVKRAREIEIRPRQPTSLQADGELLGEAPARFYVLPSVLQVAARL